MKELKIFLLFAMSFPLLIDAQITVSDITTDSIFVFDQTEQSIKSANLAMFASAVVPGIGQQYLGKNKAALTFLSIDLLSLFGAIFLEKYSKQLENDAHGYAAQYAGVDARGKNEEYWNVVGRFKDLSEYHNNLDLDRLDENKYKDPSMYFKWDSDQSQKRYNSFRDGSRKVHTVASICIGTMILNRVLSVVNIKAATRYKSTSVSSLQLYPSFSTDFSTTGLVLKTGF